MTTPDGVIRRSTKIEVSLVVAFLLNFGGVIWFAASMAAKMTAVIDEIGEIKIEVRSQRAQAPTAAVLQYRVEQLEQWRRSIEDGGK